MGTDFAETKLEVHTAEGDWPLLKVPRRRSYLEEKKKTGEYVVIVFLPQVDTEAY